MAIRNLDRIYALKQEESINLLCKEIDLQKVFISVQKNKEKKFLDFSKKLTCLGFAISSGLIKFTSHPACQKCFDTFWYDKLLPKQKQMFNTWPKVIHFYS